MTSATRKYMLHSSEQKEALRLWREGHDAKEIAWRMGAEEFAVYNGLHEIREEYRGASELAAKYGLRLVVDA